MRWSLYIALYLFPVPHSRAETFIRVQKAAGDIYLRCGALEDVTLEPVSLESAYGCAGFGSAVTLREGETLYLGLSRYRDSAHHDEVMAHVDADPEISALYAEMLTVLEMGRVVRGEFGRV